MSLILDALNRSRQESDPVPGLATQHPMEQVSSGKRQLLPWIALVVALTLVAWLLLERASDPRSVSSADGIAAPVAELSKNIGSAAAAVKSQLKSRVESERNEQAIAKAGPATTVKPTVDRVAAAPQQAPVAIAPAPTASIEQAIPETTATPSARSSLPTAKGTANDAVAQLYQQRETTASASTDGSAPAVRSVTAKSTATAQIAAVAPSAPSQTGRQEQAQTPAKATPVAQRDEQQVDLEEMLGRARDEMENTGLVEHPAPFVASLSQNTKDSIPTVLYQRHDYSSQAGRSSVVLNGKSLRVGGSPGAGMKVDEILSDSVVLNYRGSQFRLRALNSWVNL